MASETLHSFSDRLHLAGDGTALQLLSYPRRALKSASSKLREFSDSSSSSCPQHKQRWPSRLRRCAQLYFTSSRHLRRPRPCTLPTPPLSGTTEQTSILYSLYLFVRRKRLKALQKYTGGKKFVDGCIYHILCRIYNQCACLQVKSSKTVAHMLQVCCSVKLRTGCFKDKH